MSNPVHYHLNEFPPENLDWKSLLPLISRAQHSLGIYHGLLSAIPNPHILLSPLMVREAVLSSRIEGTNASVSDVFEFEAGLISMKDENRKRDIEEVVNYREALVFASEQLRDRKFHFNLLRETHKRLLKGVRGENKNPGAFREQQNWIGTLNCTIDQAKFVPIEIQYLKDGLDKWMDFYHRQDFADPLLQLAVIHLEFEALHPFLDGNGRVGRVLIPLFLFERNVIGSTYFYMSGYLDDNREQYMSRMRNVSKNGEWTEWCTFFLEGLVQQADDNHMKVQSILKLRESMQEKIMAATRSKYSGKIADILISFPCFDRNRFSKHCGISRPYATNVLKKLCKSNIIEVIKKSSGSKANIYLFPPILDITK